MARTACGCRIRFDSNGMKSAVDVNLRLEKHRSKTLQASRAVVKVGYVKQVKLFS